MKVEEVEKLKEELKEETNPRRIDKIKYLIQRMVDLHVTFISLYSFVNIKIFTGKSNQV